MSNTYERDITSHLGSRRDLILLGCRADADIDYKGREIEALQDKVEALEAAQRWIPVSERLPESGETVIVWDTNVEDFCRAIFSREMLGYPEITHWRPCFTPPTPQEQNND